MSVPLVDLELSVRSHNALLNARCVTLDDVAKFSAHELLRIPNFGKTSLLEVRTVLARHGRSLASEEEASLPLRMAAIEQRLDAIEHLLAQLRKAFFL